MFYAGVGSRYTPKEILTQIADLSFDLGERGCILRSGGAKGADTAFQFGADESASEPCEIFRWKDGLRQPRAKAMAQEVINNLNSENGEKVPPLSKMQERIAGLLARNMMIVMGEDVDDPVSFLVCWTPEGNMIGGTRYAIKLAEMLSIPVFNYGNMNDIEIRTAIRERFLVDVW